MDSGIREHHFVDENHRVSSHGSDNILEDQEAFLVVIVVQDVTQIVELGP